MEEVRSVGAGMLDLGFEFAAGGHEGFNPFDDGGLLGEMMPLTLNQKKAAKVTQRQIDLAKQWNKDGLLTDSGLRAVLDLAF